MLQHVGKMIATTRRNWANSTYFIMAHAVTACRLNNRCDGKDRHGLWCLTSAMIPSVGGMIGKCRQSTAAGTDVGSTPCLASSEVPSVPGTLSVPRKRIPVDRHPFGVELVRKRSTPDRHQIDT